MRRLVTIALLLGVVCLVNPPPAAAVAIGLVDTFEGATTQGWIVNLLGMGGGGPQPTVIPTGGPAGVDDGFLRLASIGGIDTTGSRLVALNLAQWSGNYLAAGVGLIAADVNNLGTTDLALHLLFEQVGPMGPENVAETTLPIVLPAGSGWRSVVFPIGLSNLTALQGSATLALSDTTAFRIFHNPDLGFPPPSVVSALGVDNIQAVAPEPTSLVLLGSGVAAAALHRRRRRRDQSRSV